MISTESAAPGTASTFICSVPAGPCQVTLHNSGTVTCYIGPGSATTASYPLAAGSTVTGYPGSRPAILYGLAASGTAAVGVLVSTAQ